MLNFILLNLKTSVIQLKDNKISEIIIDPKELNVNADKFHNLIGCVISR